MKQFVKWSGIAAILAGIFGIVNIILGGETWIYYTGLFATLLAVVGVFLFQRGPAGTLGLIGFILAALGVAASIIGIPGISELAYGLGMVIMGIAAIRVGTLPTWVPWLWIGAVVIGISGGFLANLQNILFPLSSVLFGLGLIGAGSILWKSE